MKSLIFTLLILCVTMNIHSQIPNAGFENWIDVNTPQNWLTNNLPSSWVTVSRSVTAHSGSYAAKVEIDDYNSFPIFPVLNITFPVNEYSQSLTGYYQFYPVDDEVVLSVYTYYFKDGLLAGSGSLDITAGVSSYTQFNFNPNSGNSGTPDSLWIQFEMVSNSSSNPGIGSYALIDQLSLGGTSDVKQINQNPTGYSLQQNYPNPFNPSTSIEFSIPQESFVELKVFDILGNEVSTLTNNIYPAGNYKADFNGNNFPSGIYIAKMIAGNFTQTRKMILIK